MGMKLKFENYSQSPPMLTSGQGGISTTMFVPIDDINTVIKNISVLGKLINYNLTRAVAEVVIDILAHAQPRVPYYAGGSLGEKSTGELRKSGIANVEVGHTFVTVGKGNIDGSVSIDLSKITPNKIKLAQKRISANVGYYRENELGEDIALWTHEELLPHENRPKTGAERQTDPYSYARAKGTGPKYLEIPFAERNKLYIRFIKESVSTKRLSKDIQIMMDIRNRKTTKYEVDNVGLSINKISKSGYWGSI